MFVIDEIEFIFSSNEYEMMLITIHDGCWKEDKFHGWGRLYQFTELEEMLGYSSGVDDNLCYEGTVT